MITYRLSASDRCSYNAMTRFTGSLHRQLMWGIGYVLRPLAPLTRHWPMHWVRRGMSTSFRLHPSLVRLMIHSTLLIHGVRPTEVALPEDQVVGPQEVASIHLLEVSFPDPHRHPVLCRHSFLQLSWPFLHIHRLCIRSLHISMLVKAELLLLMSLQRLTSLNHPHPPVHAGKGSEDCSY